MKCTPLCVCVSVWHLFRWSPSANLDEKNWTFVRLLLYFLLETCWGRTDGFSPQRRNPNVCWPHVKVKSHIWCLSNTTAKENLELEWLVQTVPLRSRYLHKAVSRGRRPRGDLHECWKSRVIQAVMLRFSNSAKPLAHVYAFAFKCFNLEPQHTPRALCILWFFRVRCHRVVLCIRDV